MLFIYLYYLHLCTCLFISIDISSTNKGVYTDIFHLYIFIYTHYIHVFFVFQSARHSGETCGRPLFRAKCDSAAF